MSVEVNRDGGRRGVDLEKEAKWRQVMSAFLGSGLSIRQFCRQHEIREPSFYSWRRTLAERDGRVGNPGPKADRTLSRQEAGRASSHPPALAPVTVIHSDRSSESALDIFIGDKIRIQVAEGCPAVLLEQVLSSLRRNQGAWGAEPC